MLGSNTRDEVSCPQLDLYRSLRNWLCHDARRLTEGGTRGIARGYYILSTTNCPPGASFDVTVYVVTTGDSIASVSQRFGCSRQKLIELNPSLETNFPPLTIGQRLRVRELRIDEGKE
jgi:hypothetical protein